MFESYTDGPTMGFQFLDFRQLHNRPTDSLESIWRQGRAGDVFGEGGEVDAGVLFCVAVGRFIGGAVSSNGGMIERKSERAKERKSKEEQKSKQGRKGQGEKGNNSRNE